MFSRLTAFARSSIGKKTFMSLTGGALILFLLGHVAGNMTLFLDADGHTFDLYADTLRSNPALPLIEIGLTLLFVGHIVLGLRTALENREARPERYKALNSHGNRTPSSVSMIVTGTIVLVFLVIHLLDFRFTEEDPRGFSFMVVERLSTPLGAGIYFIGVGALGVHLMHAFQSLFQSLGIHHPRLRPLIKTVGFGLAALFAVLFWLFPSICLLKPDRWDFHEPASAQESAADHSESDNNGGHR